MDIVKRLTLNRTPKDIPNRSLVCAKNMMIDDTGSFLTNDIGFKEAVHLDGEYIVGVIPCSSEIVILTVENTNNYDGSHVYRKKDFSDELEEVLCNWQYSGGKITGTYTYNYKNELILAIAESGASVDVPLKSFIIHDSSPVDSAHNGYPYWSEPNQTYALEEEIPQYNSYYNISNEGSLVCGTYTFFIRFLVDNNNFTKWFQITSDIHITHDVLSKEYIHNYVYDKDKQTVIQEKFVVNDDAISDKRITVIVSDFVSNKFSKFQLGYIIKRKADVQGRIQGVYSIKDLVNIPVSDNTYLEEVGIDELLENPHQFFNVENIVNYNNRLYIGNYKEYNNDYMRVDDEVTISLDNFVEDSAQANQSPGVSLWSISINIKQRDSTSSWTDDKKVTLTNIRTDSDGNVLNPTGLIAMLAKYLYLKLSDYSSPFGFNSSGMLSRLGYLNKYWFIQNNTANSNAICIAKHINKDKFTGTDANDNPIEITVDPPDWNWDFDIPEYTIELDSGGGILLTANGETYDLASTSLKSCIIAASYKQGVWDDLIAHTYYFGNGGSVDPDAHNKTNSTLKDDIDIEVTNIIVDESLDPSDPSEGGSGGSSHTNAGASNVNNRTLHPWQRYNFFVHYIRVDGSVTPGYPAGVPTRYRVDEYGQLIIPSFKVSYPHDAKEQYVGYFISYEEVDINVDSVYITTNEEDDYTLLTNAEYLYDIDDIRGITLITEDGHNFDLDSNLIECIQNRLNYNRVKLINILATPEVRGYILRSVDNQYRNEVKVLYRLTKNVFEWNKSITDKDYLPAYFNNQTIIRYKNTKLDKEDTGLIIQPSLASVLSVNLEEGDDAGAETTYDAIIQTVSMYCKYPTLAMNIKEDYVYGASVLAYDAPVNGKELTGTTTNLGCNVMVTPDRLHDLLELQPCYRAKPSKSFTNYREDNISRFDKTIYRSDVVSDESLVNGFRHFAVDEYKNITENKGKITNIVGIGFYLIVHTEYSMFVFDRSPKLTKTSQLEIPDTFDVDYQEVMPSNEGFGGLKYKEESIVSKNGYIWFDRINRIIFKYENGQAQILSADINNFIKVLDIDTVRFAEDIIHNRIIICIHLERGDYITLSYSFYSNTFISLQDYKFTDNYRTYNKSYVFDNTVPNRSILYEFDDEAIADYKNLTLDTGEGTIFPIYPQSDINKSYVDIIFNEGYDAIKALNNIDYILNEIHNKLVFNIASEEELYRRFSGDSLIIYTDETNSGELDIHVPVGSTNDKADSSINAIELNDNISYKYPAFNKGKWSLNYFRNRVTEPVAQNEVTGFSDNRSLIYGKYFVLRFIFNNDRKIKLDSVNINVQVY